MGTYVAAFAFTEELGCGTRHDHCDDPLHRGTQPSSVVHDVRQHVGRPDGHRWGDGVHSACEGLFVRHSVVDAAGREAPIGRAHEDLA